MTQIRGGKPDDEWRIECVPDCFEPSSGESFVSLAIDNCEDGENKGTGFAWLTPEGARSLAKALIVRADEVERENRK